MGTDGTGQPLPQPKMWSACVEYRDTTAKPSSWTNASVAMEIDWIGNGVDDAGQRQIQGLILGQNDTTGEPVEVASGINVSLASGSRGKIYRVIDINVPFSTAVLDTSGATQLAGAAAIRMAAGHSIAFDPTNAASIAYSASTGAIGAQYGGTSCAVGKGLAVAFGLVLGTSGSLSPGRAGSIVFLVGGGTYTINLPLANSVMAGTGFTFSVLGIGNVSIVPSGGNSIELGPVLLRQYDRYHIVSDGFALWREVFRTNAIAPHFSGPPVLPSYPVAGLPPSLTAGAKAFASNGRKPAEATGNGSGVEVCYDGNQWISVCSGAQVTA